MADAAMIDETVEERPTQAAERAARAIEVEVVDEDAGEFFAPVSADLVDSLIGQYDSMRRKLEKLAALATGEEFAGALHFFLEGNSDREDRRHSRIGEERLFQLEGAVKELNSNYWSRALDLTDVYESMPQARRNEWNKSISEKSTPDFTEETVRSTLRDLLASRAKFFSERVDGVFRGLSRDHVTNRPEGFSKRMILTRVLSYDRVHNHEAGLINDLRCVIAKFMGRDQPRHITTDVLLRSIAKNTGQWHVADGGALKVRIYKNGNGHLEVHPDMAWRLNQVLAQLYPMAIPSVFRERPKKRVKEFAMLQRPLPYAVLEILAEPAYGHRRGKVYELARSAKTKGKAYEQACEVLELLGGVRTRELEFTFDYVVDDVLNELQISGCVPDQKAHQFYPTRQYLAEIATDWADIGDDDVVLEPSAGRGDLAAYLPIERTTCVEIAPLQCRILEARGFKTVQADFLAWAEAQAAAGTKFARIVMNPPFADGRAKLHVEAAATLLAVGGILVAILPGSMKRKDLLPGFDHEWSRSHEGEFAGTSVSVVMLKATRLKYSCRQSSSI
jgi:hypothetical protein